jgi:methionyl-tRNA formyltransferase
MVMDPGIDTGPILAQRQTAILPGETAGDLSFRLAGLGAELLIETLPVYLSGSLQPQPQDDSLSSYAPMLTKEEGRLDFSQPAAVLERRVRAFRPWPGAYMDWQGQPLKIIRAHAAACAQPTAGLRCQVDGLPAVTTSGGCLVFDELQPAGKRAMPGLEFMRGSRQWIDPALQ